MSWKTLASLEQFSEIISESKRTGQPLAIFKHSTRCSVSSTAKARMERNWDFSSPVPVYLLDLIKHRDISNAIESTLGIRHESPQLIAIKAGEAIYNASHLDISAPEAQAAV